MAKLTKGYRLFLELDNINDIQWYAQCVRKSCTYYLNSLVALNYVDSDILRIYYHLLSVEPTIKKIEHAVKTIAVVDYIPAYPVNVDDFKQLLKSSLKAVEAYVVYYLKTRMFKEVHFVKENYSCYFDPYNRQTFCSCEDALNFTKVIIPSECSSNYFLTQYDGDKVAIIKKDGDFIGTTITTLKTACGLSPVNLSKFDRLPKSKKSQVDLSTHGFTKYNDVFLAMYKDCLCIAGNGIRAFLYTKITNPIEVLSYLEKNPSIYYHR